MPSDSFSFISDDDFGPRRIFDATARPHVPGHDPEPLPGVPGPGAGEDHHQGKPRLLSQALPDARVREDFVCSDVSLYDQMEYSLPGKVPPQYGVEPDKGCPFDCGLCTEHEQHTCVGLVEMTVGVQPALPDVLRLERARGHAPELRRMRSLDRPARAVEGRGEVLQLSGGEPTIHPEFLRVLDYAVAQPIDIVMINTNGIRLAHDTALLDGVERAQAPGRGLFPV